MKSGFITACAVGLILGLALAPLIRDNTPQAYAQGKVKQWEYRVESFHSVRDGAVACAQRINKLAEDGWEYVGVVCTVTSPQVGENYVAFKRLKN